MQVSNVSMLVLLTVGSLIFATSIWPARQALAFRQQQADFYQIRHMDHYYDSLEVIRNEEGDDSNGYKVKATRSNGNADYYYFSREADLLTGMVLYAVTAMGSDTVTIQNNNYQSFDSILMPTELVQNSSMSDSRIVIDNISFAEITDLSIFSQPN